MPIYRVRKGYQFGARKQHGPGALVELTEGEAASFADKLELVEPEPGDPTPLMPSTSLDDGDVEGGDAGTPAFRVNPESPDGEPVGDKPGDGEQEGDGWGGINNALRRVLAEGGFDTPEKVRAASDDDLLAVKGIGPKVVALIREKLI